MNDKEILTSAPSGWPVPNEVGELDGALVYVSNNDNGHPCKVFCKDDSGINVWCHSEEDYDLMHLRNRRSLADIQRIVELEAEVESLKSQNIELAVCAEACQELTEMDLGSAIERLFEIDNTESSELVKQHNLKQQAKGIEDAREEIIMRDIYHSAPDMLQVMANQLLNQAKELNDGKK
tara:strand:- start:90 stop:626 length:537 start_codon:yes stop_codon:yes gene_type:complete